MNGTLVLFRRDFDCPHIIAFEQAEAIENKWPTGTAKVKERCSKISRYTCISQQIHFKVRRAESAIFEVFKLAEVFEWGLAQQQIFEDLKQYLIHLTTLSPPSSGAPLLLYISSSHSTVSASLVQEKVEVEIKKQELVYFISKVLGPSKKKYTKIKKVLYAVLMATTRHHKEWIGNMKNWKTGCGA